MSSLSLRMSALFCCSPSDYMNIFSPIDCLRHLEAVRFKDLCRYLRYMLKDYLIRFLSYYTRTSPKDIIEVHCKQMLSKIMKIALWLRNFRGLRYFSGGVEIFSEGLTSFRENIRFFREGLRFFLQCLRIFRVRWLRYF